MAEENDPEAPRDVLAAEEFVVPAPDPLLQHEPLEVPSDPDDPEGQLPPHDVLAGEEFPIPAAPDRADPEPTGRSRRPKRAVGGVAVALLGLVAVLRRRRGDKTT